MKILILFLTVISSLSAQEVIVGSLIKKIEIDEIPSFFFKVKPDGSMLSYTIPKTTPLAPGQNKILEVSTGTIINIPGVFDPVFIGSTNLLITPNTHTRYSLFDIADLFESKTNALKIITSLNGYYQSTGILNQSETLYSARIIAESPGGAHRVIDLSFDSKDIKSTLVFDDNKQTTVCPNMTIKLPMLSKDGQYIGGLDLKTKTTGVWRINSDYSCEKVIDLGIKTGKVNFDFSNSRLAYHIYKQTGAPDIDSSDGYVAIPDSKYVANIYIVDLKTLNRTKITDNHASNSLYPDFTKNGELVFINHPHAGEKVSFNFVRLE